MTREWATTLRRPSSWERLRRAFLESLEPPKISVVKRSIKRGGEPVLKDGKACYAYNTLSGVTLSVQRP
jgi:hypothetical protein